MFPFLRVTPSQAGPCPCRAPYSRKPLVALLALCMPLWGDMGRQSLMCPSSYGKRVPHRLSARCQAYLLPPNLISSKKVEGYPGGLRRAGPGPYPSQYGKLRQVTLTVLHRNTWWRRTGLQAARQLPSLLPGESWVGVKQKTGSEIRPLVGRLEELAALLLLGLRSGELGTGWGKCPGVGPTAPVDLSGGRFPGPGSSGSPDRATHLASSDLCQHHPASLWGGPERSGGCCSHLRIQLHISRRPQA